MIKFFTLLIIVTGFINSTRLFAQQESFSTEELIGKTLPKNSNNPYKLRSEVYDAFLTMAAAAKKENIDIQIVSAFRSYERQKQIYDRKFKRYRAQGLDTLATVTKIIEYSTIPGTSRHHWGTDIDIIQKVANPPKNLLVASNFENDGPFCPLKEWMDTHAKSFGFKLVYTKRADRKGFKYEPWHFTYYPTSEKMLNAYLKGDIIEKIKKNNTLKNEFINKYLKYNILDIF